MGSTIVVSASGSIDCTGVSQINVSGGTNFILKTATLNSLLTINNQTNNQVRISLDNGGQIGDGDKGAAINPLQNDFSPVWTLGTIWTGYSKQCFNLDGTNLVRV